ncbi:Nucleoporin [Spathaspora sp. JA1]|nr:Nucleoporin [Spathaspora sp. JA1]
MSGKEAVEEINRATPMNYQAPSMDYQAPQFNYQAPPYNYQAPPFNYQAPPFNYQAPPFNYQAPPYNYQTPPYNYQAPPYNYQNPPFNYQAPPFNYQAPMINYQAPAQSQPAAINKQALAIQSQPTVINKQALATQSQPTAINKQTLATQSQPTAINKQTLATQIQAPPTISSYPLTKADIETRATELLQEKSIKDFLNNPKTHNRFLKIFNNPKEDSDLQKAFDYISQQKNARLIMECICDNKIPIGIRLQKLLYPESLPDDLKLDTITQQNLTQQEWDEFFRMINKFHDGMTEDSSTSSTTFLYKCKLEPQPTEYEQIGKKHERIDELFQSPTSETGGDLSQLDFSPIINDLLHVLITPTPLEESRTQLLNDAKPVTFSNGAQVKLNQPFIEISAVLANELDLNELSAAELLYNAGDVSYKKGTSIGDAARFSYYSRLEYILNILGYLIIHKQLHLVIHKSSDYQILFDNLIKSFEKIYKLINNLHNMVDKQKVTSDINSLGFINSINFAKSQLFNNHELLGKILYGIFDQYFEQFGNLNNYNKILQLIQDHNDDGDILQIHYLPGLLQFITKLLELQGNDKLVGEFHTLVSNKISEDYKLVSIASNDNEGIIDLSKSKITGVEIVTDFFFLSHFITWCKEQRSRTDKYDFKEHILKYMEWLISYGVMERILCYCAETSNVKTQQAFEYCNVYDFRSLLQRNFPKLTPCKFQYPGTQELLYASNMKPGFENIGKLLDVSNLTLNQDLNESLIAPFWQRFFSVFIVNAAIVLTQLRDLEEDFVLSSINRRQDEDNEEYESKNSSASRRKSDSDFDSSSKSKPADKVGLDLDEVASRADLERFYLAFAYTFNNRPGLCNLFWSEEHQVNSDIIGFISWGLSNNTSPLITATFCILLSSLASGGNETAARIWEILVNNNNITMKKNDYSKISVDSLVDSLNYYLDSLNEQFELDLNEQLILHQKKQEFLFSNAYSSQKELDDANSNRIVIELAEDSIVFISGFIQLISGIVKNLSNKIDRGREIKNIAYDRFQPIIKGFLKFDNLIKGGKILSVDVNASTSNNNPKFIDLPTILVSDDSMITLINLVLTLLGDFVDHSKDEFDQPTNSTIGYEIWRLVDRWLYFGLYDLPETSPPTTVSSSEGFSKTSLSTRKKYTSKRNMRISQAFSTNLTHFSEIVNFTSLIRKLLTPFNTNNQAFSKYSLLYPCDLGLGYRINNQIGIWPYIEFLMLEVFGNSHNITNKRDRQLLQLEVIEILINSLEEIDWKFLCEIAPQVIRKLDNFDNIFDSVIPGIQIDFSMFVKLHQSLAVLHYLFDPKFCTTLFKIIDIGADEVNSSDSSSELVRQTLDILDKLLNIQPTYFGRLLPLLKNKDGVQTNTQQQQQPGINTSMSLILNTPRTIFDNVYYPKNIGSHGVDDFYEILLFHLSTVVHFALYVGCNDNQISSSAISILQLIDNSKYFHSRKIANSIDPLLENNRLLTTFQSIDESIKIKYAFIDKFESHEESSFKMKYKIIEFLLSNLKHQPNGKVPTVAHFLLGFDIRGNSLCISDKNNTLLKTLLHTLSVSLDLLSEIDYNDGNKYVIDIGPAKLSSLILEILIKLIRDPISSVITLNQLREYDELFEKLINYQPKLDLNTIWCGVEFNGDLQVDIENQFIEANLSLETFFSFISQRNLILQYLSLEFHHISSISKKEHYIDLLINNKEFLNHAPKILGFLDVLNYSFKNFEMQKYESLDQKFNMLMILQQVKQETNNDQYLDLSILNKIVKLLCQGSNAITNEGKLVFAQETMVEGNKINEFVTKYLVSNDLKEIQLKCLHSWCQLIEILITDTGLNSTDFLLQVLQIVIPKTNDYLETDISFSAEMISLCVLLFDFYEKQILNQSKGDEDFSLGMGRLIPLFQTCLTGILNSNSTPNLRSDLYVLCNKFLMKIFDNDSRFILQMIRIIKSSDQKFLEIICNDAIYSEGSSRITSTLLLESLIHLGSSQGDKSNFILDSLVKNNSLLLLVRSIKRTDQMIKLCVKSGGGVTLDNLIFELTAFKATLYLLVRVSQSKTGALQLIQSELFSVLRQSNFLSIDPDLGLNLNIEEGHDFKSITVNVLLDTPSTLNDLVDLSKIRKENTISYFEFLIPIFQLIATVLMAMGPTYKPGITETKGLMKSFNRLIVGVLKRDVLLESRKESTPAAGSANVATIYKEDSVQFHELQQLVRLFTLIDSLVNSSED